MDIPEDFPKTAMEFQERFKDEEACREYMMRLRWPNGFVCPACGTVGGWRLETRDLMECSSCHRQTSLTAGTIFQGTRKPLRLWFWAMFLMSGQKLGLSAKNFMRMMGFTSYQTAWTWLHKLRHAMVRKDRPKLSGKVEVDEAYIGGVEHGAVGRGNSKPIAVVAVERLDKIPVPKTEDLQKPAFGKSDQQKKARLGRVRIEIVEDFSQASLLTFVSQNIERGSKVITDGLNGYDELGKAGFDHRPVVIGKETKKASSALPGTHRVISLVKRWILGTHQGAVSPKHLLSYLQEYTFRFNRRLSSDPIKLFHRLLEQAVITQTITYRSLVDGDLNVV
jgi:transposase-like protein